MRNLFGLSAIAYLIGTLPAHAYIDPVSASFLLQAIVGGFAAAMVFIKRVRTRILSLFGLGKVEERDRVDTQEKSN